MTLQCSSIFANSDGLHPRLHAKHLDKALGYRIPKIEVKLLQRYRPYDRHNDESNKKQHYKGTQTWIGLHPQVLQTPYCDIYTVLSSINKIKVRHVVDIGAGYGRVGVVVSVLYPDAKFTGYEVLSQRQAEGNRVYKQLGIKNAVIKLENVLDHGFELPQADVYFIYDFSEEEDISQILLILQKQVQRKKSYLITRGDRIDNLMKYKFKHAWKMVFRLDSSDLKVFISRKNS
ncbi:class I SAM-dependent methyltransferase [Halobacteriovorax marinus]|uniref:class I SAM-dependent methyltransferase n=1 Tax=Halobacteriovorax marinus TaxID=97084 RepID=UPI0012FD8018|nr:class I SAM-dependent methyltransferase [Halobacteriovorax marinus]